MTNSNPLDPKKFFLRFDEGKMVATAACGGRWGQECITADALDVGIGRSKFSGKVCDGFGEEIDDVLIRCGCGH